MHRFPSTSAQVPPDTMPMVAGALRSVKTICEWDSFRRCDRLESYWRGTQYESRAYDWNGAICADEGVESMGVPIYPPNEIIPLSQRRPPANYRIGRVIVGQHTGMLFGEGRFPEVHCKGDPDDEDFARAVVDATGAQLVMKECRDLGGACGTVLLSWQWRNGDPIIEVHNRKHFLILGWQDEIKRIPSHALKIWPISEPGLTDDGQLTQLETWMAREWRGPQSPDELGIDRLYRYVPEKPGDPQGLARWVVLDEAPIDECKLVWIANTKCTDQFDGAGDFEGCEGQIDELNITLCATSGGVARNVDPTLVLNMPPAENDGSVVRKGGFNTIFSERGASYLEMSGSATQAGITISDKTRALIFEQGQVVDMDPEKMTGAAQSGEALRRLMFPMTTRGGELRTQYGQGLLRALEGLLRDARNLQNKPPPEVPIVGPGGEKVIGPDGAPMTQKSAGYKFNLPPRPVMDVETNEQGEPEEKVVDWVERKPGKGALLTLKWPEFFPDTAADKLANIQTIQAANGQQPVISARTGVTAAAPMFGVVDVDKELHDIEEQTRKLSDAKAGSLGMPPGAGPPGDEEDEDEQPAKKEA